MNLTHTLTGRARILFGRRGKAGAPPGTIHVDPEAPRPRLTLTTYGPDAFEEREISKPQELGGALERYPVTWLNVDGLGDARVLAAIGEQLGLHDLVLEDIVHTRQRPKVEDYADHLFVVVRMLRLEDRLHNEQVSIILGERFVVTFQEHVGDCFEPVRDRLRRARGRLRAAGADYLAYALIDAVVDHTFPVLEAYGERIETLEDEVVVEATPPMVGQIHDIKHDLLAMRRAVWPLRDALAELYRDPHPLFHDDTRVFLRDAYDHTIQVIDVLETYRELASSLMDAYMTSVSNRINDVMRVLTLFASIFIPLTFVAGVYGMNFNPERSPLNMPELNWYWGYPAALAVMGLTAVGSLTYFWRKGWIGGIWRSGRS